MVTGDRYNNALNFCLKEMFLRVGETYPNEDLTNDPEWYILRSWTIEEENKFRKWMITYLRKKLRMSKKRAETETFWFLMMYGWTNKYTLNMKVVK